MQAFNNSTFHINRFNFVNSFMIHIDIFIAIYINFIVVKHNIALSDGHVLISHHLNLLSAVPDIVKKITKRSYRSKHMSVA